MKSHDNYYRKVGASCVDHMNDDAPEVDSFFPVDVTGFLNFLFLRREPTRLRMWLLRWLFSFLSGDELLTDTYKITIKDDVFFEVEGKVRNCSYCVYTTVYAWSDTAAIIYFITQFGAASVWEWLLIESGVY